MKSFIHKQKVILGEFIFIFLSLSLFYLQTLVLDFGGSNWICWKKFGRSSEHSEKSKTEE